MFHHQKAEIGSYPFSASLWKNFLLQWDCSFLERVAIYHSPKWKHSLDTNVFFFLCLITEEKSEKEMSK